MLFLVICNDLPDTEDLRRDLMPQHGPHIQPLLEDFAIGGWLSRAGRTCGSAVVMKADSREKVEAYADPYFGPVWRTVEVMIRAPDWGLIGKTSFDNSTDQAGSGGAISLTVGK